MTSLIMQYWLNHELDPQVIRQQMAQMAAAGYQGVFPHPRTGLRTPYFGPGWWAAVDAIVEACREHGLECWIWDEDYYPSGLAGGRIVWERPEYEARGLEFSTQRYEGAGPFELDCRPGHLLRCWALPEQDGGFGEAIDVTALVGTRRQQWGPRQILHRAYSPRISEVGHPHWRCWMTDNRWALVWTPPAPGAWRLVAALTRPTGGEHPDLLRPEPTQRFLELSHDVYHQHYAPEFGQTVRAVFTDEPSPGGGNYPWTDTFPAAFTADHGYELRDQLYHLALDVDARSAVVRHHYRLTQHRLQTAHYLQAIGDWCHAHGVLMTGHLTRTEWLSVTAAWWPNELRSYRPMDIPATDPLGGSVAYPDAAAYHTGLKVVSSAAHLFGREQASSDVLAIVGDEAGLRDLKHILDYHLVLGVNHFALHGVLYSADGARKDEVPPSLFIQHPQFRYMRTLMDHIRDHAAALTGGEHVCSLGVLYPSTSLACQITGDALPDLPDEVDIHALSEALLSHQRDFDLVDEVTLQECVAPDGRWLGPEPCEVLLLPYLRFIDAAAAAALVRFAQAGGRVIAIGRLPLALPATLDDPVADWHDGRVERVDALDPATLPGPTMAGEGARDVFLLRRRVAGELRQFLFNRRETEFHGTLDGRAVTVPPRGSLLLCGDRAPAAAPAGPAVDLSAGWQVTFEPNQLPLSFWHVEAPAGASLPYGGIFGRPGYDLMRREADPAGAGDGPVRYWLRFMLTGAIPDARLVIDPSTFGGDWTLTVNDAPVTAWSTESLFDLENPVASVGELLRGGSTPTLNVLCLATSGPGRGLREVPFLVGSFAAEYRYGHLSFPFVTGGSATLDVPTLQPWAVLGRPTFSGGAVYRREVVVPATGEWWLDLGRVEDLAAVRWDGGEPQVVAWPPYRVPLGQMRSGRHEVTVEVVNPPANRDRAAGRAAGLLGPVRLVGR